MPVQKFLNHSKKAVGLAKRFGWLPGARYTNLRDARTFDRLGFLDIDWKNYNFSRHLKAAKSTNPLFTVARDIERRSQLTMILDQAFQLLEYSDNVIIVPKPRSLSDEINHLIPSEFLLGYSVPTKYGGTRIQPRYFRRAVHLLGGRPDVDTRCARFFERRPAGNIYQFSARGPGQPKFVSLINLHRKWRELAQESAECSDGQQCTPSM